MHIDADETHFAPNTHRRTYKRPGMGPTQGPSCSSLRTTFHAFRMVNFSQLACLKPTNKKLQHVLHRGVVANGDFDCLRHAKRTMFLRTRYDNNITFLQHFEEPVHSSIEIDGLGRIAKIKFWIVSENSKIKSWIVSKLNPGSYVK